jgi:hypothetical protein
VNLLLCLPLLTCTVPVTVTPCASPTPVVAHAAVDAPDIAAYELSVRPAGYVVWEPIADLPCEWNDEALMLECRSVSPGIPLQRYCPACEPFQEYEFAFRARSINGLHSTIYSEVISVCFSPVREWGPS